LTAIRPQGQVYRPELIYKISQRYSFAKHPQDYEAASLNFLIGKFENVEIGALQIYNDGIIVESKADTNLIDNFIDDFAAWCASEFDIVSSAISRNQKFYESTLIVQSDVALETAFAPKSSVSATIDKFFSQSHIEGVYKNTGFILNHDTSEKGPGTTSRSHIIERRIHTSFEQNVYYSISPLRTSEHIKFLSSLEKILA